MRLHVTSPFIPAAVLASLFTLTAYAQPPAHDPTAEDSTTTDAQSAAPAMTPEQLALIDRYLTTVHAQPAAKVDTRSAAIGQGVTLLVTQDATLANGTELPKGTRLTGRILRAQAYQSGAAAALLSINIDRAVLRDGSSIPIRCVLRALAAPAGLAAMADASQPGSRRRGGGGSSIGGPVGGAIPLGNPTPMGGTVGADTSTSNIGGAGSSGNGSVYNPNSTSNGGSNTTSAGSVSTGDPGIGGSGTSAGDRTRAALGNAAAVAAADPERPVASAGESIHDTPHPTGISGVMLSGASIVGVSGTLSAFEHNIALDSGIQLTLGVITTK